MLRARAYLDVLTADRRLRDPGPLLPNTTAPWKSSRARIRLTSSTACSVRRNPASPLGKTRWGHETSRAVSPPTARSNSSVRDSRAPRDREVIEIDGLGTARRTRLKECSHCLCHIACHGAGTGRPPPSRATRARADQPYPPPPGMPSRNVRTRSDGHYGGESRARACTTVTCAPQSRRLIRYRASRLVVDDQIQRHPH